MKQLLSILALIAFFTISCKKDKAIPEEQYVPGDLSIGITSNADLRSVFDTLNVLDLKIATMHGFFYNVDLPADSLNSLLAFLDTKNYINTGTGWKASGYYYEPENTIRVLCSYFDMTPANQFDFLNTVSSLNLIDKHEDNKYMFIKVPVGSERYWLNELKKYPFIKWTELNYIDQFKLH